MIRSDSSFPRTSERPRSLGRIVLAGTVLGLVVAGALFALNARTPASRGIYTVEDARRAEYLQSLKSATEKYGSAWFHAPWAADEAPFQEVRSRVERSFRWLPRKRMLDHYTPSLDERKDVLKVFAWATAFHEYRRVDRRFGNLIAGPELDVAREISDAMGALPDPGSREWTRARALVEMRDGTGSDLKTVVLRLQAALPEDLAIAIPAVEYEWRGGTVQDAREALKTLEWTKTRPDAPTLAIQHMEAFLLKEVFRTTKNPADQEAAIQAFERYIKNCPPEGTSLPFVRHTLSRLQNPDAEFFKPDSTSLKP